MMNTTVKQLFSGKHNLWLWGLSIAILVLYNLTPRLDAFDTYYYLLAGDNFWSGTIDCLRTPVYPLLLKLFSVCLGDRGAVVGIILLQSIVYLVSVASLRNVARCVIRHPLVRNAVCLMYIVCVAPGWCNELLTESLSISGCVILTDCLFRYLRKPSWRLSVSVFLLTLLLVFLRPSFIFLFAILPCVWIVLWVRKNERWLQVVSLLLTLVASTAYLAYCKAYEKEYGVFTSSISFVCNDVYNLKRSGLWDISKVTHPHSCAVIAQLEAQWSCNYDPIYRMVSSDHEALKYLALGCDEMKRGTTAGRLDYWARIASGSFDKRFQAAVNTHTPLSAMLFASSLFLALPLSIFYGVVVISCIALVVYCLRRRGVPLMATVLILFSAAQCVGILLYASEAHERLLVPVYPMFLVLLGMFVEKGHHLLSHNACVSRSA